jgi:ribose 5-phosphate isomerase A
MTTHQDEKIAAARRAVAFIEPGMLLGLGSGSTVDIVISALRERLAVQSFPLTVAGGSRHTEQQLEAAGLHVIRFDDAPVLDLLIDGADEVDPHGHMIKGGGGALVREKILAFSSRLNIIAVDSSKPVEELGAFPVPVAVVPFGWQAVARTIARRAARIALRTINHTSAPHSSSPHALDTSTTDTTHAYRTDDGHYILDCAFPSITDPRELDSWLTAIPGIVDTGLFIDLADRIVIARGTDTEVRTIARSPSSLRAAD